MKKYLILTIAIFSITFKSHANIWDIFKPSPKLPMQAVEDQHVDSSQCLKNNRAGYSEYFDSYNSGSIKKIAIINGKKFNNQYSSMLQLYKDLTGYRKYRLNTYCTDIGCEIESLLGKSYAHKLAFLLKEYNFNASYLSHLKGAAFEESELDIIIWSFKQLPDFMYQKRSRLLIRDTKEYSGFYANVAGFTEDGTGNITFFNKWANSSRSTQAYTVIHEYGHLLGNLLGLQTSFLWAKMSKWNEPIAHDDKNESTNLISEYSRTNPSEDFAESFSAYRFNPGLLKEKAPRKYELIRDIVFLGLEYDQNSCSSSEINNNISTSNLDDGAIIKACEFPIMSYKLNLKPIEYALACVMDNSHKLKLSSFETSSLTYKNEVTKNFTLRGYPWLGQGLVYDYLDIIEDKLIFLKDQTGY